MELFATVADLEARWRGLAEAEQRRAAVLLEDATSLIKDLVPSWQRAAPSSLRRVVCAMVRRAMAQPSGLEAGEAIASAQVSAGPFSQQLSYANPNADLYLTRAEKNSLGLGGKAKGYEVNLLAPPSHEGGGRLNA